MVDGDIAVALGLAITRTPRSYSVHVYPPNPRSRALVFLIGVMTRAVIAQTPGHARSVATSCRLPDRWIHIVPNMVGAPSATRWAPAAPQSFGVVSRFATNKGLELIPLLAELLERAGPFSVVVHGDGPLRQQIQQRCAPIVRFAGMTTSTDETYADIDVLIILSPVEVGPTTALEAAARGIPVVSLHPLPGLLEALGKLALVPPRPDVEELVALIVHTTEARTWPSARSLHQRTTERFDRTVVARRFVSELSLPIPER
jgi:glycosyltransferase involved in cell wall biosynthesis